MSEFTKGQESIIREIFDNKFNENTKNISEISKQVAEKEIISYDESKIPIWNIRKSRSGLAIFLAALIAITSYIADTVSGNLFINNMVHEIIGTKHYIVQELDNNDGLLQDAIVSIMDEKYNLEEESSELSQKVLGFISSYISKYETPDHPIPDVVRKVVGSKPILVFHGEGIFGRRQRVLAEFPGCTDIVEALGNEDVVTCEISADIPEPDGFSVPFYASLYGADGARDHDIHAIIAVNRIVKNNNRVGVDNLDAEDFLNGVSINYVRTKSLANEPDYIDITKSFKHENEGFFLADVGEKIVSELQTGQIGSLRSQSFFHALDIVADSSVLHDREEILIVQLLIFINRHPEELTK